MASSDQRAYVYLQLPQSLEVVTAGFYELDFPQGVPTGSFVYNPTYLQRSDAVPLEPYELPLTPRRTQTVKLKGIFGALRDASPDAWGRRIIEKHTGRTDLTEIDYLLAVHLEPQRDGQHLRQRPPRALRVGTRRRLLAAVSHTQLQRHQIEPGDGFGHRALNLQTGVHLHEVAVATGVEQKLQRARALAGDGLDRRHRRGTHALARLG